MSICDPTMQGAGSQPYHLSYIEAVEGKRHAYTIGHGPIHWTRSANHPVDSRCPECNPSAGNATAHDQEETR